MNMYHIRQIGPPALGPHAQYGNLGCSPPFEPISTNQDDSKHCEHLQSQENDASYSNLGPLHLASISIRSRLISGTSDARWVAKRGNSGSVEADEHETGQYWALIPSTEAGQQARLLFYAQK